jgi:hypothetical protein
VRRGLFGAAEPGEIVGPPRLSGVGARPLNFTVSRSREVQCHPNPVRPRERVCCRYDAISRELRAALWMRSAIAETRFARGVARVSRCSSSSDCLRSQSIRHSRALRAGRFMYSQTVRCSACTISLSRGGLRRGVIWTTMPIARM